MHTLIGLFVFVIGPFVYAVYILMKLDAAAKRRKKFGTRTKFRFMIVDFLSLILLLQLPFNFLDSDLNDSLTGVLIFLSLLALLLVWFTTIKTVSQAGIVTVGWRALVSMILIPTMYVGCFYFGIVSIALWDGQHVSPRVIVWLIASLVGMVVSPWIVRGALNSVDHDAPVEPRLEAPDPFAD